MNEIPDSLKKEQLTEGVAYEFHSKDLSTTYIGNVLVNRSEQPFVAVHPFFLINKFGAGGFYFEFVHIDLKDFTVYPFSEKHKQELKDNYTFYITEIEQWINPGK